MSASKKPSKRQLAVWDAHSQIVAPQDDASTISEKVANFQAGLIAQLLAALEQVAEFFENHGPPLGETQEAHRERMMRANVRAAIAKTHGENGAEKVCIVPSAIVGSVAGGCVEIDEATIPPGVTITLYDYDFDGSEDDDRFEKHPETGDKCIVLRFEHSPKTGAK